jgi:hypothetical protein
VNLVNEIEKSVKMYLQTYFAKHKFKITSGTLIDESLGGGCCASSGDDTSSGGLSSLLFLVSSGTTAAGGVSLRQRNQLSKDIGTRIFHS